MMPKPTNASFFWLFIVTCPPIPYAPYRKSAEPTAQAHLMTSFQDRLRGDRYYPT